MRARRRRLAKQRRLVAWHRDRFTFGTHDESYRSWKWLGRHGVDACRY